MTENRRESGDTRTLSLAPLDRPLPRPRPGQFTMVYVFGVGEIPLSVSGHAVNGDRSLTHTVRAVGAVSAALCRAEPGTVVGVRGPFGTGWEVSRSRGRDLLFVAGGIGLAPLRPPLLEVLGARREYGFVTVVAGARTPADHLYGVEDECWRAHGVTVLRIVDRVPEEPGPRGPTVWPGPVGLVTDLLPEIRLRPERTTAYLCGPEAMMTHTGAALTGLGMGPAAIEVSLERNMRCGVGVCGHCQLGPDFVCLDGPVTTLEHAAPLLAVREL
ncbi:FAD/NAD(P)-binding protein [Catenulispora subtropica]|uniref:FAD/NAD(P)-binding protein n=1 Tax=Catenulispora subtropica TaxID=450798 RepID=A0ABN2TCI9_9ACTN